MNAPSDDNFRYPRTQVPRDDPSGPAFNARYSRRPLTTNKRRPLFIKAIALVVAAALALFAISSWWSQPDNYTRYVYWPNSHYEIYVALTYKINRQTKTIARSREEIINDTTNHYWWTDHEGAILSDCDIVDGRNWGCVAFDGTRLQGSYRLVDGRESTDYKNAIETIDGSETNVLAFWFHKLMSK